jgi:hypothetical protein
MRRPLRPLSGSPSFVLPDGVPLLPIYVASADPPFLVDYRFGNIVYSVPGTHQIEWFLPSFGTADPQNASSGSKAYFHSQRFFDFEYHKHNSTDSVSDHYGKQNDNHIPDISTSLSSGTCLLGKVFALY